MSELNKKKKLEDKLDISARGGRVLNDSSFFAVNRKGGKPVKLDGNFNPVEEKFQNNNSCYTIVIPGRNSKR